MAHLIGWMVKMFALRDIKLAMIQQVMFELMEITFRHWLPNFYVPRLSNH
jgi:phosphatidylserine synthase 2